MCECIWLFLSLSVVCLFFDALYFSLFVSLFFVFVFFNFSNIVQVYLNLCFCVRYRSAVQFFLYLLSEFLFIGSFQWESLSRCCTRERDNGQACPSVTIDRQHLPTHVRPTLGICMLTWGLQPYSVFPTTLLWCFDSFILIYCDCVRGDGN